MNDHDPLPRKLAAILYADVAEYSRLTGDAEDATHRKLRERLDFISEAVDHRRGRVMHFAGDAVLAMFGAVMDAVFCAAEIQGELERRDAGVPQSKRVRFRIGVNLGDVIEDRGDIYGDGVNVAARLQTLADPGGICISESVHTAVGNKLDLEYSSIGEHRVKNIETPIRAYRITTPACEGSGNDAEDGEALQILIADDHALIREALKNVLGELGERVSAHEAHDSVTALTRAESIAELDLVLLDLDLPGVGGFAVLTQLRQRHPEVPVVVLTAQETREAVLEALNRGAMGFIPRSSTNEVMLNALRLVLSGGQYLPAQVLPAGIGASASQQDASSVSHDQGKGAGNLAAELGLTVRQRQVLALLMQGKPNKLISRELDVAERTVKIHVSAVLKALNVTRSARLGPDSDTDLRS